MIQAKAVLFRFSAPDMEALVRLSDGWGVSQIDVVRLLLRDAARRLDAGARPPVLERLATPGQNEDGGMHNGSTNLGDQ